MRSPGGDALASDLMWRELQLLAKEKPVIASMADVAASGGYYMAMACNKIVAEELTLTGSIGVVTGKFNFQELFAKVSTRSTRLIRLMRIRTNQPFSIAACHTIASDPQQTNHCTAGGVRQGGAITRPVCGG
jgi:enoyl-CoA hydratase/carnithine racemase